MNVQDIRNLPYIKPVIAGSITAALALSIFVGNPFEPQQANAWEANMHKVQPGESFWAIGRRYGVEPAELASHNGMQLETVIHPGDKLALPGGEAHAPSARTGLEDWQYETLVAVVQQEAGPGNYESALWVMTTILNRMDGADYFGNTIWEVITAHNQFEAYFAGHYERYLGKLDPTTEQAVQDALAGYRPHGYVFFYEDDFAYAKGLSGTNVGGNLYYYR